MKTQKILRERLALLTALLALIFITSLRAAAPAAPGKETKRLFWKITSPTTTVYFLGSIHAAAADMYPLPAEIEAAFKDSSQLVVECDVTKVNQDQLTLQIMQQGMYPPGDSLDKHLSPQTYKAVSDFFAANGMPMQMVMTMKPAMASLTIESMQILKTGLDPSDGIDMHFLNAANSDKSKKIVELETADYQLKLLFGLDDKLADRTILESLKEGSKDTLDKVIKAWKEGDDKTIDTLMTGDEKNDPDEKKMNQVMLYDRNDAMVKKIDDLLKGREKAMVVVGAAHLVGDKGILKQLEAKGYKVERPKLTTPPATKPAAAN